MILAAIDMKFKEIKKLYIYTSHDTFDMCDTHIDTRPQI